MSTCFGQASIPLPFSRLPAIVWQLDPEAPLSHPQVMDRLLQSTTLNRRFETGLVSGSAAAALLLANLGLFSVASLSVARRTKEFGVRLALGEPAATLWGSSCEDAGGGYHRTRARYCLLSGAGEGSGRAPTMG